MRLKMEGALFCKLEPFALGRFLQIEGGAKKQIRTPAGDQIPARAARASDCLSLATKPQAEQIL